MAKRKKATKALVILGHDHPDRYDAAVCVRVVDCDRDGRIGPLQECTLYGARVHAWGVIKRKSLVDQFLKATKGVKGACIVENWFQVERTDILNAMLFMNGDAVFGKGHRLAYLKDALDCRGAFAKKLMRAAMTADA